MVRALITILVAAMVTVFPGSVLGVIGLFCRPPAWLDWSITRFWGATISRFAGVRLKVTGRENVPAGGCFLVGNHQSALDIPILIQATGGRVRFMAKDTLFKIPVFGWIMRNNGYIPVDRSSARRTHATIKSAVSRWQAPGYSLAVFPEGTRSSDGRLLPFRRGALKIGKMAGLPLVPFTIDGSHKVHRRRVFRATPGEVRITFHNPLTPDLVAALSPDELHDRVHEAIASGLRGYRPVPAGAGREASSSSVVAAEGA